MSEKNYVKQENHATGDCRINEEEHSQPGMDCGHVVESGSGVGPQKAVATILRAGSECTEQH